MVGSDGPGYINRQGQNVRLLKLNSKLGLGKIYDTDYILKYNTECVTRNEIGCPFVIEVRGNRINFTQPLCLPCSLLWFISSPTLYEKRQPATKRGLPPILVGTKSHLDQFH